jgi:uncharacterized LabA/DUF88 family protein
MDRSAVFVDAGYLFAAGSILLCGEKLKRGLVQLSNETFLDFLRKKAEAVTGLPLLRIYWYDGTDGPPTGRHIALAYQPDVKLRLGLVNRQGAQKGVDSLIVTDLINLSRNRAMAAALLLTGDEDIRVGVQQAQEYGVRVHLVGIAASPGGEGNQAALLKQEADTVCDLSKEEVAGFLTCAKDTESPETEPSLASEPAPALAANAQLGQEQLAAIVEATTSLMPEASIQQVGNAGRASIPSPGWAAPDYGLEAPRRSAGT